MQTHNIQSNFALPAGQDKNGLYWKQEDVTKGLVNEINLGNAFQIRKEKQMNEKIKYAVDVVDDLNSMFEKSINNLIEKENKLSEVAKKASGNVRNSANDLLNGLLKIEKTADFNRLERYVELLERASVAISTLAELEKTGKLEKIAASIR
jgi:hypothetical protein